MAATTMTEVYDAVLSTTLFHMLDGGIRDNISKKNKLVAWLKAKGRQRQVAGGERIKVPLMYGLNSTADIYQGYGQLGTTPQDGITSAFYPWAQMAVSITISGLEDTIQNAGEAAQLDLLRAKTTQSEASAVQLQNTCVVMGRIAAGVSGALSQFVPRVGTLDPASRGPLPLAVLVDANPSRSVVVGEINGATELWWQNQALDFASVGAATFAAYKQAKNRLYNNCARGIMGNPDLIISDQWTWELYWNSLESKERYVIDNQRVIDILGGAGEDMLKFRGAVHVWDEVVPDVGTTTATPDTEVGRGDGVGTYGPGADNGTEYHLNAQALEWIVHSRRNWAATPFISPTNQDAKTSHLLWGGQCCAANRRKLGVLFNIDTTIAA